MRRSPQWTLSVHSELPVFHMMMCGWGKASMLAGMWTVMGNLRLTEIMGIRRS